MSRVVVKVCGITDEGEALECLHLGVDVLGFHFWPGSPRCLHPRDARRIIERIPAFVTKVGVFVDEDPACIRQVVRQTGLTAVQLHGDESPEACEDLEPLAWYKAFRVGSSFRPDVLSAYRCSTYLLDAWRPEGGPSAPFDWSRARRLSLHGRIVIAGGLDPSNVEDAVRRAAPYGVDVASGVEAAAGRKDLDRVEAFVLAVRRAEEGLAEGADADRESGRA